MNFTELSIKRPLTMLMIILAMVVFGWRSYTELQVDRYPAVDFPVVSVIVAYPGAGPEDVENDIVKPIEDAIATVGGVDGIIGKAQENVGIVVIQFQQNVNAAEATSEVERKVSAIKGNFPNDALEPSIVKADLDALPIVELVLSGDQGQNELYALAVDDIQPRLQAIKGVASVTVSGGQDRIITVEPDPAKLAAYGIPIEALQQKLIYNNISVPSGSLDEGRQKTTVRSMGDFTQLDDIENVVIAQIPIIDQAPQGMNTGGSIYVRDLAVVSEGYEDAGQFLRYNGEDAVSLRVIKTSDANTVEVADKVHEVVAEINAELPAGAKMTIALDDSEFTRQSIDAVIKDLILAILITGLVILLFLHNIRSTFIVLLAIPTSLISTFAIMWMMGFTLNVLTLLALTLTIGILVDDSIVVIENIERHLKMGKKPWKAALDGRMEIGMAAVTITLVDVAIYVPIAFTEGTVGQFFRSYGVTIASTVLLSLFISFTLTPMLAALWLQDETKEKREPHGLGKLFYRIMWPINKVWDGFIVVWEKAFDALANLYALSIRLVLKNSVTQSLVILLAAGSTVAGIYMISAGMVGSEFLPQEDDGKITVNLDMPAGTNLDATDEAVRQAELIVLDNAPETVFIISNIGSSTTSFFSGGGGGGGANKATLTVQLVDKNRRERSTTEVADALRESLKQIPEASASIMLSSVFSVGSGSAAVELQVYGEDPTVLASLANQVEDVMASIPGAVDIINTDAAQAPEAQLVVDREMATNQGLTPAQVGMTLRTTLNGAEVGTYKDENGNDLDIILRMDEASRNNLESLLDVPVGYNNRQQIRLGQVTSLTRNQSPAVINRTDRQRTMTLSAGVSGRASGDVMSDLEVALDAQVEFPAGYGYEFSGMSESQTKSFQSLIQALFLGILFMYILMVALFQSWLHPITIMTSLPVATVGAFGGLYLFGMTLNIFSLLGIILLMGIVTKNAILLVDFTNELRAEQGYSRKKALVEAGRLRLRPILMTTFTIAGAMTPILLSTGAGSEVRAPLAAVLIGGSLTSTLLTLILVPVVYSFFDSAGELFSRLFRKLFGGSAPETQVAGAANVEAPLPS